MPLTMPDLESYLRALGEAVLFVGDPFTAGGLEALGAKEGDVTVAMNPDVSTLTFPEATGTAVHGASVRGVNPVVSIPLIIGNPDLWAKISPVGTNGAGSSAPEPVVETSLVIIPKPELDAATASFENPTGLPAAWVTPPGAPVNWLWFWRGFFIPGDITLREAEHGKSISTVQFQVMYDSARPAGMKQYYIGDPTAATPPESTLRI